MPPSQSTSPTPRALATASILRPPRFGSGRAGVGGARGAMDEDWLNGLGDELAAARVEAEACAEACEALLEEGRDLLDATQQQRLLRVVVAPVAISRILAGLA